MRSVVWDPFGNWRLLNPARYDDRGHVFVRWRMVMLAMLPLWWVGLGSVVRSRTAHLRAAVPRAWSYSLLTLLTVLTGAAMAGAADVDVFIETATRHFRDTLSAAVQQLEEADLDAREVLGDPGEFAARAVRATAPVASPWNDLIGPFTKTEGVQARLGISRQAVAAKAARRRLLRVYHSRRAAPVSPVAVRWEDGALRTAGGARALSGDGGGWLDARRLAQDGRS